MEMQFAMKRTLDRGQYANVHLLDILLLSEFGIEHSV